MERGLGVLRVLLGRELDIKQSCRWRPEPAFLKPIEGGSVGAANLGDSLNGTLKQSNYAFRSLCNIQLL